MLRPPHHRSPRSGRSGWGSGPRRPRGPLLALLAPAALCALLAGGLGGCKSLSRQPDQGPDPLLTQADALYETSDYESAAQTYRLVLDRDPGDATDRILFRLAMIHLLPDSPVPDPESARVYLDRLVEGFPESPFAEPARLVLDLEGRIAKLDARSTEQAHKISELTEQLEALKRIDLERTKPPHR